MLVITIVVTNIFTVIPVINSNLKSVKGYGELSMKVTNVTEPDAVIFLDYWDKAIFPERKVGIVKELPEEGRDKMLTEIIVNLSEDGVPVYLQASRELRRLVEYEIILNELSVKGYKLLETEVNNLYELIKLPED
jgi:hypothetical protein